MKAVVAAATDIPFLDLVAQHAPLKEEIVRLISETLDSAAFVGGAQVTSFETEFAGFIEAEHVVGISNGTDALRLALHGMGIGRGDRVVTVPNTFIATTEAISQVGAKFDFVDVDADTCLMDPNRLESFLRDRFDKGPASQRPRAIVPVHLYGHCVDMDPVMELAAKYELLVLEDAAQAHGARYKGRGAGTLGHAAAFSFYAAKNLGACGEAGAVTTANAALAEKIRMLREHGQNVKYYHPLEGYNARLDAVQAGILRIKLRRLEQWNASRREIAAFYDFAFASIDSVRPVKVRAGNISCYHLYVIHVPKRDALQAHLKARGIGTGLHYPLPLHLQECYAGLQYSAGDFPNAERSASTLLSLPMFPELGLARARRVVDAIASFRE
jgi:dTDP-4-amino-4,6-dideoxygalactose transaminase